MTTPDTVPLFPAPPGHEKPAAGPLVLDAEDAALIDLVAERTAAKIAEGLLRLPEPVRQVIKEIAGGGYYLNSVWFGTGARMYEIRFYMRETGLELAILNNQGTHVWRAVLV